MSYPPPSTSDTFTPLSGFFFREEIRQSFHNSASPYAYNAVNGLRRQSDDSGNYAVVYPNSSQITGFFEIVGIDSSACSSGSFFFLLISLILAWFVEKILWNPG